MAETAPDTGTKAGVDSSEQEYHPKRFRQAKLQRVLTEKHYRYCHFTDVSGKGTTFESMDFSYCVFVRGYFHNSTFSNCKFTGAHLIDSNFRNATIRDCDFAYANFSRTRIPVTEVLENLPPWPNVRRELLQTLRSNASLLGDYQAEKTFILHEIAASKEHLRRAWRQEESYYRKKYGQRLRWLGAGVQLFALKVDSFVWGHGERLWKAPIALVLLLLMLSVALAVIRIPSLPKTTATEAASIFFDALYYHANLFLDLPMSTQIIGTPLIDAIVVITRMLVIGIIIAALYRRLSHR